MVKAQVTFYRSPDSGGKKVRRIGRTIIDVENREEIGSFIYSTFRKTQDPALLSSVTRIVVEVLSSDSSINWGPAGKPSPETTEIEEDNE